MTDAAGRASTTWTLGPSAGEQRVSTSAVGLESSVIFSATAAAGPAALLTVVAGNGQSADAGTLLPEPLVVRATDGFGNAVGGATVTFAVTGGGGSVDQTTVATSAAGAAETRLTLGSEAGANTVSATVPGAAAVTFTATAVAPPEPPRIPTAIVVISGSGQTGAVNTALSAPLVVEVRDAEGRPVSGVPIGFQVVTGSGTVVPSLAVSGQDGRASANWTLGTAAGPQQVSVSALGVEQPAVFTATAIAGSPASLTIVSGNAQTASAGAPLPLPLSVRVTDAHGNPVAGTTVTFAVTGGGGSLSQSTVVTDAAGGGETRLTLGSEAGLNSVSASVPGAAPVTFTATALAADGQRIAYVTQGDGSMVINLINTDGTDRTHLTDLRDRIGNPSWSPDGSRLVFEDYLNSSNHELYVINRDGTGRVRLTETSERESDPSWSPDGSRIAFVVTGTTDFTNGIYVMNVDGTGRQRVLSGFVSDPAWSPDGTRLLFTRQYFEGNTSTGNSEVSVANADGTNEVRLTNREGADRQAAWSPDGSRIAFAGGNVLHLWIMDADGTDLRQVTVGPQYNVSSPSWSPDGVRIAFSSLDSDGEQVRTIKPDGTGQVPLTRELSAARQAAWSPR